MPKNNRFGQSAILSDGEYFKIRSVIKSQKYKLLLDLAWYTGERWGAIVQLQFSDVYLESGKPRETITFRASTRKASVDGTRKTREVPVHQNLRETLRDYKPEPREDGFLFPAQQPGKHLSLRLADKILRNATEKSGLGHKGISTHSTRRSFITKLHSKGIDLYTLRAITGHQDFKALSRYVEIDTNRIVSAINLI